MVTQPLTLSEEEALRQIRESIQKGILVTIKVDETNRDMWLNILNMAERANEIVTEQWKRSPKSTVNL